MTRALRLLGALLGAWLIAGCASTEHQESELPWNTPQPWETAPTIPGLNSR